MVAVVVIVVTTAVAITGVVGIEVMRWHGYYSPRITA
jgi:hypothetical protein